MGTEAKISDAESHEKKGVTNLREIMSKEDSILITDLDDTVKESGKTIWPDGKERKLLPETVISMLAVHMSGVKLGIATEQPLHQIIPFVQDISILAGLSDDPFQLFNGPIVAEGGSVVYTKENGQTVLASDEAIRDRDEIVNWLWNNVIPSNMGGWSILIGTNPEEATYVQLPPKEDVCIATASLWEKGPHVSTNPEYVAKYKIIENKVVNALGNLGITTLTAFEAGNGTLRIAPKYINKASSMQLLSLSGLITLNKVVYSCDGPNDVDLAKKLKEYGGGVIAVGNAVPELHNISTYSASQPSGSGFAEAISLIFPNEYLEAQKILIKLGSK